MAPRFFLSLFFLLIALSPLRADSDFTGIFDINNWSFESTMEGSSFEADAQSITIRGSQNLSDIYSLATFSTTVSLTGTYSLSFRWDYVTTDPSGPNWDPAAVFTDQETVYLSNNDGENTQGGDQTIIFRGGLLQFGVYSDNYAVPDADGFATLSITNFTFAPFVAVPSVWSGASSGNWTAVGNWSNDVPNGEYDVAQFGVSTRTSGTINSVIGVDRFVFTPGASAYTFTVANAADRELTFYGAGIVNNSGTTQTIINRREMLFRNASSAGNAAIESRGSNAHLSFIDNSTAGDALITLTSSGNLLFSDSASAGHATIISSAGSTLFQVNATAGDSIITVNNGTVDFWDAASAGRASITINGNSSVFFLNESTADDASIILGGGHLFIGEHANGMSFGALSGTGQIWLNAENVTVGQRNTSTVLSASLSDGGLTDGATGASLTKVGTGSLTLRRENSYTGGTTVKFGTLIADHNGAMGTGEVKVEASGTFRVASGITISNSVSLAGGKYIRELGAGASLANIINHTSDLAGGVDTTALILSGTTSGVGGVGARFSLSDGIVLSDILHLDGVPLVSGSKTDVFVLQLSMTSVEPGSFLAWLNENNQWVNAVDGNFENTAEGVQLGFNGSFSLFQLTYGETLAEYVGAWGRTSTGVWAVLNHNSEFGVIPEPSTMALLGLGAAAVLFLRRRKISK